jgi:hypothetical protein
MNPINYDDNIFFIIMKTKTLQEGLALHLHSSFWSSLYIREVQIFKDILVNQTQDLLDRPQLIKWHEHLFLLRRAVTGVVFLLQSIEEHKNRHSLGLNDSNLQIKKLLEIFNDLLAKTDSSLKTRTERKEMLDAVGDEEMAFLLSNIDI